MSEPPGLVSANALERAVLKALAAQHPSLRVAAIELHVLSREFTGVGCYTTFADGISSAAGNVTAFSLAALIEMPGVAHGMTAVLFCRPREHPMLEIVTLADERWAGDHTGFHLSAAS